MMRENTYNRSPVNTKLMTMKKAPNPMLPEDFPSLILFALFCCGVPFKISCKNSFLWVHTECIIQFLHTIKKEGLNTLSFLAKPEDRRRFRQGVEDLSNP